MGFDYKDNGYWGVDEKIPTVFEISVGISGKAVALRRNHGRFLKRNY